MTEKFLIAREYEHLPGSITMHVLHSCGGAVSASILLEHVERVLQDGKRLAAESQHEFSVAEPELRGAATEYIANSLLKLDHAGARVIASSIITTALWLALTADEPMGAKIREALNDDVCIAVLLKEANVNGKPVIRSMFVCFSPDTPLDEVLAESEMEANAETMLH
jgi:hypothetical protein